MHTLIRAILCGSLLVPSFLIGQSEFGSTEPQYHWPEYSPFSPGSWAWPTMSYWQGPAFEQNFRSAAQPMPSQTQPPTIIVFAPMAPVAVPPQPSAAPAPVAPQPSGTTASTRQGSPIYLIALKSHAIRPALSYSVEDQILHYVDLDRAAKEVPLDQVDRALTL